MDDNLEMWSSLAVLLDVVHKAAAAGPNYAWILKMANDQLETMRPQPEVVAVEPPEPLKPMVFNPKRGDDDE